MSSPEGIERLEKRLRSDPTSKVFLPVAEAHRKAGQTERALDLLRAGLEHNPSYIAAQVALARTLMEIGQNDEACLILSDVVSTVPENLLAARLL
ncbi:MAG: tetratricopeptide repeat protein, partial [Acidobacteriota bacterium]